MKPSEGIVIAKHVGIFLREYAPAHKTHSEHTLKGYEDAIRLYLDYLKEKGVTPVTLSSKHFSRSFIEDWLKWLVEVRQNSPETRNVRLTSLREFLKYLASKEPAFLDLYIDAKAIPRLREQKRKVTGLSTPAVEALLAAPNPRTSTGRRDIVFMSTLYNTAARVDEVLSLRIEDLHLNAKKPCVNLTGKGRKVRTVYLVSEAVKLLKGFINESHGPSPDPKAYVFYSRTAGQFGKMTSSAVDKMLKKHAAQARKACHEVPENLHAHQLRHAKASHWLEGGMNIVQISLLLGHAQLETTMTYLDITLDDEFKALATLSPGTHADAIKKWKQAPVSLRELCGL